MKTFIEKLLLPTLGQGSSRRSWSEEPRKVHCLFIVKYNSALVYVFFLSYFGLGKERKKTMEHMLLLHNDCLHISFQ